MTSLLFVVLAYLMGSLSFAVITSRLFGLPDPHAYGSGNPGATNVLRTGNKAAAALTLLGDGLKGWLALSVAKAWAIPAGVEQPVLAAVALVSRPVTAPVLPFTESTPVLATAVPVTEIPEPAVTTVMFALPSKLTPWSFSYLPVMRYIVPCPWLVSTPTVGVKESIITRG